MFAWKKKFNWKSGALNSFWVLFYVVVLVILTATDSYSFGTIFNDERIQTILTSRGLIAMAILFVTSAFVEPKFFKGA